MVGPPLAVAAACIVALVWFGRAWIPAQQEYLNERNLRTLRTIATQVKAKVDGFEPAIDHAIASFPVQDGNGALLQKGELLQKYVKLFSPDLEIVELDPERVYKAGIPPDDPPNVRIQRDEGKGYLYLAYWGLGPPVTNWSQVSLIARADIDRLAASYLAHADFDAVLLVDGRGATIAQRSSSGLELTSVDTLRERGPAIERAAQPGLFERIRGTTGLAVVTIGAAEYMFYAQPVPLSLMREVKDAPRAPEEWTLCGLVHLDRFRAASSTIPTTYWLMAGVCLALICLAIPLVKPRVLGPRERLRRLDGVCAAAGVFLMMALATFIASDLLLFGIVRPGAVDEQLHAVAESISDNVRLETEAIAKQLDTLEDEKLWQDKLAYHKESPRRLDDVREFLAPVALGSSDVPDIAFDSKAGGPMGCNPSWSCRSSILRSLRRGDSLDEVEYPFFQLTAWSDDDGWQRIKWSTSSVVTPFINADRNGLAYFESLTRARRLAGTPGVPTSGVSVLMSPNTGEKLTVFWKALPELSAGGTPKGSDLLGQTLATVPVSLTNPVLPQHVQFAVLDPTGLVLFHSDATRSLAENFFQESEGDPNLKALAASADCGVVSGRYQGRAYRLHVRPLGTAPFGNPGWSLVVFQDQAVGETANLETLYLAASMFAVYAVALAAIWAVLGAWRPDVVAKWLWPDPARRSRYRPATAVCATAGVIGVAAPAVFRPSALIAVTVLLVACAVAVAMVVILRGRPCDEAHAEPPTWLADFFRLRTSLLFLLAGVPATVCFQVASAGYAELVTKQGRVYLAAELDARARRIDAQAQRVTICDDGDHGPQSCAAIQSLVARRTTETLWDINVPTVDELPALHTVFASTGLQWFLMRAYWPYNDIAASLLRTASSPTGGLERWHLAVDGDGKRTLADTASGWTFVPAMAPQIRPSGVSWLIALALMGVAYALVRYVHRPMFVLDINAPAARLSPTDTADQTSLLVIGPSRLGRTRRLRRDSRVRIFDVVSLSFTDQPIATASPASAHVGSAADSAHAIDDAEVGWTESIRLATSNRCTIVALDHLEYRLGDPAFRQQMLPCLESAVHGQGATIWCSSARDPVALLNELDPPAPDRHCWAGLFEGFRREYLGLAVERSHVDALAESLERRGDRLAPFVRSRILSECRVAPELIAIGEHLGSRVPVDVSDEVALAEIGRAAEAFYAALWGSCSIDERVVLRQLAEGALINPNNSSTVTRMLSTGLIRRTRQFHLMNETFRRFVIGAATPQVISDWEHEGVRVPWATIATTGMTIAFGLAGLMLLTQEQLVDAWISYLPALAPAIPTVWKALASSQRGRIDATA